MIWDLIVFFWLIPIAIVAGVAAIILISST